MEQRAHDTGRWSPSQSPDRLAQATMIVMGTFVASRLLGLVRNMVISHQFGTTREYEAFVAAIAVPDFVFQVLAGGAVASAFIPVFAGCMARGDREDAWRVASSAMAGAAALVAPLAALLAVFAYPLMSVLVPGWDPASRGLAANLARIMLVSPILFALSGFATSVLNSFHKFFLASLAPIVYNLAIIGGAVLLYRPLGIYGLAAGVAAGAALHLLVQVPGLLGQGMRFSPVLPWRHPEVRRIGKLMLPRMVGLGVVQINQLVVVVLASFLAAGSLAYLNFAWLVTMTPLGIFAMAISTAMFPSMAHEMARGRPDELRRLFSGSLRVILYLTVPASAGLVALAVPVVRLLFQRGEFTPFATEATAYALVFYSLGLAGHATVEIADRAFYSLQDTLTPVLAASAGVAINLTLGLALMRTPMSYGGLALASSLAALAEAGLLLAILARRLEALDLRGLVLSLGRTLLASVLVGAGAAYLAALSPVPGYPGSVLAQVALLGGIGAAGALLYVALTAVLGSPEVRLLLAAVGRAGRRS